MTGGNIEVEIRDLLKEIRDLMKHQQAQGVKIDAEALMTDLGSGKINQNWIHLFTWNHRWMSLLAERNRRAAVETYDFIDEHMPDALFNNSQMGVVRSRRDEIAEGGGSFLDLGVYKGGSTRSLADIFHEFTIHGFDSFEGLPEDWSHVLAGTFGDISGKLPDMPKNVKLYKGWFDDTLPTWLEKNSEKSISLLRVDCDIYSSTKTIFDVLEPLINADTWIVFDELIGYRGWKNHEYKAFMEFIDRTGYGFEYISYGLTYVFLRLRPAE